ncbi:hypothetical protein HHI36_010492 [Cryptolaemus montrouzieri]|uniref:Uncharacterized protein n=1 Tax=Cryptolaemus montrouzieri TaxID=559131 RepID=A0ABD2MIY3_9CUCU
MEMNDELALAVTVEPTLVDSVELIPQYNALVMREMKTLSKRVDEQNIVEPAQEDIMELEEDGSNDDAKPVKITAEQDFDSKFERVKENFNKEKPSGQLDY